MRVSLKIAVALAICLLVSGSEAGGQARPTETSAPEETPSAVTIPLPSETSEQISLKLQLSYIKDMIREHAKTTETLDKEVRAIQQYVAGGLLALPLLLLLAFG